MKFEKLNALDDEHGPMIYVWRVGADVYVGKSINGVGRAVREYHNNVRKMLAGQPYRKSKPDAWRRVHRRLHAAMLAGETITLELIPSTLEDLLKDEERLIRELGATLNGGGR